MILDISKELPNLSSTLKSLLRIQLSKCATRILNRCKPARNSNWQGRLQGIKVLFWIYFCGTVIVNQYNTWYFKGVAQSVQTLKSLLRFWFSKCVTKILNWCKPTRNSNWQGRLQGISKSFIDSFCGTVQCDALWCFIFQRSYSICPDLEITVKNLIIQMCH